MPVHKGRCHCGAVEFTVTLPNGLDGVRRCDCSMCRRRGAVVADVLLDGFNVIKGCDKLALYQFHTMTARHHFCTVCGIYTHHQQRSNPDQFAFKVGCLDEVNVYALGEVPIENGVNHPDDR